ncbi:carboxypeptidase B-like [Leptopilina heterotoma]|uniref:carboxypeptidase B-like n=1 Tax=Leptopilina heterotoma TaxID=63436 RepID=UPI001CA81BE9|nr:carboxypeptidase B-like [Leptopilina heterotoma]
MNLCVSIFFASCFVLVTTEYIPSTKGMQWLSITCDTDEKLSLVLEFQADRDFDFMTITRQHVEVAITAGKIDEFKRLLELHDIEYKVYIEDVQQLVKEERNIPRRRRRSPTNYKLPYSFDHFPRHYLINSYLHKISLKYPDATLLDIGTTFEDRKMYGVKISNNDGNETKPAILIDAGIHAREWISITTALFVIQQLLKDENKHLYKNIDWYIFPSMNPDGYEFSHSEYRLWRKTRSDNSLTTCKGVDGNRNYDYKWKEPTELYARISENPCDNTYPGDEAFSEVETRNLRDFALSKNGTIKLFIDLHATSQNNKHVVIPWSFTKEYHPDYSKMLNLADRVSSAIYSYNGSNYTVGTVNEIYYIAPGTSIDWFLATAKSSFSYCIELPSLDFVISENKIEEIGSEIFEAMKVFGKHIEDNFV